MSYDLRLSRVKNIRILVTEPNNEMIKMNATSTVFTFQNKTIDGLNRAFPSRYLHLGNNTCNGL